MDGGPPAGGGSPAGGVREDGEVTVLGAGIVGLCCALSLLERGHGVRLIDRDGPGRGASFGNAGVVSPWSVVPQCLPGIWRDVPGWLLRADGPVKLRWRDGPRVLPWALRFLRNATPGRVAAISDAMHTLMDGNIEAYRHHLAGTPHADAIRDSHYVMVYEPGTRPDLDDLPYALRRKVGARVREVGGSELRALEPALSPRYERGVLIEGQARLVSPARLCEALADKARALGATIERLEVTRLERREGGGVRVHAKGTTLDAPRAVIALGGWSGKLLAPLGVSLPLMAERGYHMRFERPGVELAHSVMDVGAKVVVSSMEDGLRTAGTAEFAAVDAPPDMRRTRHFPAAARRLLPDLDTSRATPWMGVRPSLPDNLPAIGPIAGLSGVVAAFGHSHYGMGMAPATGRFVAQMLDGGTPNADMTPFSPRRFA